MLERPLPGRNVREAPLRRGLSTFTYLAVALLGDDQDRARLREAVNRSHAHVRSDARSPVGYSAFDPELQLWVAACLYVGWLDVLTRMHGPLGESDVAALYAEAARLGTTLQVEPERWPPTTRDFAAYWQTGLASLAYDDETRAYLVDLLELRHLPAWLRLSPAGRFLVFTNTGFLPDGVRAALRLPWSSSRQRHFEAVMRGLGRCYRALPSPLRTFPLNACLRRFRRRARSGRPPW